jgi:hypothetical protein
MRLGYFNVNLDNPSGEKRLRPEQLLERIGSHMRLKRQPLFGSERFHSRRVSEVLRRPLEHRQVARSARGCSVDCRHLAQRLISRLRISEA